MYSNSSSVNEEIYDFNSVPYGYFQKYKFTSDKKANWFDLTTKDQRKFKFKFDSADDFHKSMMTVNS